MIGAITDIHFLTLTELVKKAIAIISVVSLFFTTDLKN